ncbi:hypothetical protein [Sphingomonas quercus]|uniref:Uncharacterized protein n=1 Tax=Sphingomonas quercus TaxID=2842451 RepID=A0ABS6BKP9_9SPHN|nr:hypothetical protein [Sphingomonas quercus]MBU3078871.1 hypothetical protein [Sphingomonas quercus]
MMVYVDLGWPMAAAAGRGEEAARLMLEALRILDEIGSPAAGHLSMALDDLGVATPIPRFAFTDLDIG